MSKTQEISDYKAVENHAHMHKYTQRVKSAGITHHNGICCDDHCPASVILAAQKPKYIECQNGVLTSPLLGQPPL